MPFLVGQSVGSQNAGVTGERTDTIRLFILPFQKYLGYLVPGPLGDLCGQSLRQPHSSSLVYAVYLWSTGNCHTCFALPTSALTWSSLFFHWEISLPASYPRDFLGLAGYQLRFDSTFQVKQILQKVSLKFSSLNWVEERNTLWDRVSLNQLSLQRSI